MKAYFSINSKIYANDEIKITLILSKMGTRKEIPFSEIWYDKMANISIKAEDKTLTHFIDDYEKNFCPFDIREKAHRNISRLYQKPGKDKDGIPNDSFQNYIHEFQNLATKAKFEDKLTACTHFSTGLDWQISTIILSMATLPDTLKSGWTKPKISIATSSELMISEVEIAPTLSVPIRILHHSELLVIQTPWKLTSSS